MKVIYLKTGWEEEDKFAKTVEAAIKYWTGVYKLVFHDIKISSNGQHCLLLFKEKR